MTLKTKQFGRERELTHYSVRFCDATYFILGAGLQMPV
jgi:hypothetical protein